MCKNGAKYTLACIPAQEKSSNRALKALIFKAKTAFTSTIACKYGLFAAALACLPAIVAAQQLFVEIRYTRLMRLKQRAFAAGIHRHIAVSRATASQLSHTFSIPAHKLLVVHPGIPAALFSRTADPATRASLNGETGRPIVLSVARLDRQKGQVYLLQASARVPEAVLVLVGDGPDRQMLEAQTLELGVSDRVILMGYRRDLPELLAACDVFVMSSLWDGLSLSILEAMAAGKPVIATDVGGAHEAVEHGATGLLVPPADPVALADTIRIVLSDSRLAQALADAGRSRARQEFSVETMVRRVTEIYDELLEPHKTASGQL